MINRYIYVYQHNGVPIYVGSSGNPKKRDAEHVRRNRVPFDRLMTKLGRENFSFEIVETVIGETVVDAFAKAVPRENFWMDKFKTWHECGTGGQNFMRLLACRPLCGLPCEILRTSFDSCHLCCARKNG